MPNILEIKCSTIVYKILLMSTICKFDGAENVREKRPLNIAIIGAGPGGLLSAKYSIEYGYNVTVFEQQDELGGVWVYRNITEKDKYGVNVRSSMYKGLRTNLPYQVMQLPNHPYPNGTTSFPSQEDILKYIHSFADHFDLNEHIKLNHLVIRILPIQNDKWEVIVKDLPNNKFITHIFDAVFVCNGHYYTPFIPDIDDLKTFNGQVIHSRDFRSADTFHNETVLIIGTGPSGRDLAVSISKKAKKVFLSQNEIGGVLEVTEILQAREKLRITLSSKPIVKGNVKRFTAHGADFMDGTQETFTSIIFATGYRYSYPFLSVESGIHVDDNFVQPLYKHIFNIQYSTMAFIGIPRVLGSMSAMDLQVRFALKFVSGEKNMPSKSDMLADWRMESECIWKNGCPKSKAHNVIRKQVEYQKQLSDLAGIRNLPPVVHAIALDATHSSKQQFEDFRKFKYTIVDNYTFIKEKYEK